MKNNLDDETLIKLSYVNISSYRVNVVKTLKDDVKTPTKIAKDSGIRTNHISKVLKELKDKQIVICTNEQDRKNRNYHLTGLGREIAEELK